MNLTLEKRRKVLSSSLNLSYTKPLHIVRGSGQFLYDKNGLEYLDGVNNIQHVGHTKILLRLTNNYRSFIRIRDNQHVSDYAESKKATCKLSVYFYQLGNESNV